MGKKLLILFFLLSVITSCNRVIQFNTTSFEKKTREYQDFSRNNNTTREVGDIKVNLKLQLSESSIFSSGKKLKIGLALGGGAAKGLAHIGVLKALEDAGIEIDYIAGSSMGALIGAAFAAEGTVDSIEQIALGTDWKDVVRLFDPTVPSSGFINGERVKSFLETLYGNRKIEDLSIPYAATAADISTGRQYIIDKGSLAIAVRTSISIPVVFKPQKHEDIFLVDGGLVDPVPINVVRAMGADFIIAVNVLVPPGKSLAMDEKDYLNANKIHSWKNDSWFLPGLYEENNQSSSPSLFQIAQKTVMISQARIAQLQIKLEGPDLIIEPDTRDINAWDFHRGKEAIDIGYKATVEALKNLQKIQKIKLN